MSQQSGQGAEQWATGIRELLPFSVLCGFRATVADVW